MSNDPTSPQRLRKLGIAVWVGILILVGTYFRVRPQNVVPEADWLIKAQLSACFLGGVLGFLLMRKHAYLGFGAKVLLVYLVAVAVSSILSPYPVIVLGYWILLSGVSLLTIGLVQRARSIKSLCQIENAWLLTLIMLLLKDTIISILFSETQAFPGIGGPFRLGMGSTHPNAMSLAAAIAFWISFKKDEVKHPSLFWLPRILFLFIIVLSRSRISMICFVMGGIIWFFFQQGFQGRQSLPVLMALPFFLLASITSAFLALSFDLPGVSTAYSFFHRNQDLATILSMTGRTEIWLYAIERVFDSPYSFLLGHGYGISRFVLNQGPTEYTFFASHAHNAFIEVLLSTGLIGAIPFLMLFLYSFRYLTGFRQLGLEFSPGFVLRAISVLTIIFTNSILESNIALKINPMMLIFIFYILALDRRRLLA